MKYNYRKFIKIISCDSAVVFPIIHKEVGLNVGMYCTEKADIPKEFTKNIILVLTDLKGKDFLEFCDDTYNSVDAIGTTSYISPLKVMNVMNTSLIPKDCSVIICGMYSKKDGERESVIYRFTNGKYRKINWSSVGEDDSNNYFKNIPKEIVSEEKKIENNLSKRIEGEMNISEKLMINTVRKHNLIGGKIIIFQITDE